MTTVPEQWRKSTRSAQDTNCVELSNTGLVRDSKNPDGPTLRGARELIELVKAKDY